MSLTASNYNEAAYIHRRDRGRCGKPKLSLEYQSLPHQYKVLTSQKQMIFDGCGVGAGKTDVGGLWALNRIKRMDPTQLGVIAANSYSQLKDSTLRNLYKNYRNWGIPIKPKDLPAQGRPMSIYVWNTRYGCWSEILCRSLDNYEMLSGLEVNWIWVDEAWQTSRDAIDLLLARLRDDRNTPRQLLVTTTLDDPESWMYKLFVEEFNPKVMDVIYATTYENYNLPEDYIPTLQRTYTKELFQRMVMAEWITLGGVRIYYAFSRNLHVPTEDADIRDVDFDPELPVCWTLDFNIGEGKPMSSALAQVKKYRRDDGTVTQEVHFFDEIVIESADTSHAIDECESKPWFKDVVGGKENFRVYGDATGRHRDTRSRTTDYEILTNRGFYRQYVPMSNPSIRNRHNAVNSMLLNAAGEVRVKVHPRCKTLIKGLATTKLKKGAGYVEDETYSQHITTAVGYFISFEFPVIPRSLDVVEVVGS